MPARNFGQVEFHDSPGEEEPTPAFLGRVFAVSSGVSKESRMTWEEAEASSSAFVKDALAVRTTAGLCDWRHWVWASLESLYSKTVL